MRHSKWIERSVLPWAAVALVGLLHACGGEDATVASCPQRSPTGAGVYGCVTATSDVAGADGKVAPRKPLAGFGVSAYAKSAADASPASEATARAQSNDAGYFELALPPGYYALCTSFMRCTQITVRANESLRRDYDFGVGPGWSS